MKISVTTFTIALSTFSACVASTGDGGIKHEAKLGMRRHIVSTKRSPSAYAAVKPQMDLEQASRPAQAANDGSAPSMHQHEKRAYYGQGTYFQPGEGW